MNQPCSMVLIHRDAFGHESRYRVDGTAVIGAADEADIRIADPAVSALHCAIVRGRGHREALLPGVPWFVADLSSGNGTWLNGIRIRRPLRLHDMDEIRLGRAHFLVVRQGEAADTPFSDMRVPGRRVTPEPARDT